MTEFPDYSEWDLFAKGEYERLAMEEEGGADSDIDAMDGWDSEDDTTNQESSAKAASAANPGTENRKVDAGWDFD